MWRKIEKFRNEEKEFTHCHSCEGRSLLLRNTEHAYLIWIPAGVYTKLDLVQE